MNKETYTKIFLHQSGETFSKENLHIKLRELWFYVRKKSQGGLRLSDKGLDFVKNLNITTYEVPFPPDLDLKAQVLLFLDKFIDCPYHLSARSITVLSEKKALELYMFSGDVRKYGLIKAMKRKPLNAPSNESIVDNIIADFS